jgi:hypothetical protein|tara:strand:+ start:629 stop:820 length:192 start_codon:yes stop_codon:yes gene_type:complete
MQKDKLQLTSVKVHRHLFDEFKVECVRTKFSFQKLADRALCLYLTDKDFKKQVHNQTNLTLDN